MQSLYDASYERASCGLGFVARVDGRRCHEIVEQGLALLGNLAHRGATGSDPETGDGAGVLLQVPDAFLRRECRGAGIALPPAGGYAVGMLFLPTDPERRLACEGELERVAAEEGQRVLGWRDVPVEPARIGATARAVAPCIRQVFIERSRGLPGRGSDGGFALALYRIRRRLHWAVEQRFGGASGCYVVSLSASTLVYKGLLRGPQLAAYYPDLRDPEVVSALALVHSRFSTNTLGSWPLAHPYRYAAHNGEINTLRGNINWMRAREAELQSALFGEARAQMGPIVQPGGSDSAAFDNALEFLVLAGRSLPQAVMTMVPEAWENDEGMDPDRRAFYQYHSWLMAPWDGPAAIAFSDGKVVGATLDRNGLRPARYSVTRDGLVVLASEEGALPIAPEDVVARWRLQPGRMLLVDTVHRQVIGDDEIKGSAVRRRPYRKWVEEGAVPLSRQSRAGHGGPAHGGEEGLPESEELGVLQRAFGYTLEDLKIVLEPMAATGKEPDGSMGTDTPLAVLSERPQLLFSYFKQLFAQVTNPPIDPLREELVMSLQMSLGPSSGLLHESRRHCRRILLDQPILSDGELAALRRLNRRPFRSAALPTLFPAAEGPQGLEPALEALCQEAERAVDAGATILILSDRGVNPERAPIPSLLATSAVHHHLVRTGKRTRASLVVETGEAREVHHVALLIGYGASAVNPYLACETVAALLESGQVKRGSVQSYCKALQKGLLKVISKMGISTLVAYCGAQVFEAVGLDRELVERHFTGTASRIGGVGIEELGREVLARHRRAFGSASELDVGGQYQLREQGEYHQWNPGSIASLQRAVRTGRFASFEEYTRHFDEESARLATLRGLFRFRTNPIPLEEVEPAEEIVKRFSTGAMSLGSLSREAHETIALAMNRMGGKSNTGEGGEEPERSIPDPDGGSRRSAIKQVASGRFGVTTYYLVDADVLQIKMAQGSKPGEGGQLPGHKVTEEIGRVRHATPGVGLISPPPHHDIYSIEDLAQLIHDLKNVNPTAQVSVKLVSEVGVGTIAAGVAKAKADHITISGYDGGTGASPLSSIKHAGLPWELGLAEAQQVLVANGLRGRVRLQTDGHLKTGRDVVIAALLGADEFAFSTAPLVAMGCIMVRACHLNTCPVGIATQNPALRRKFAGKPEHVINYFFFVAEEVRRLMAELGLRRLEDLVGRGLEEDGCLQVRPALEGWKLRGLDLSPVLCAPPGPPDVPIRHVERQHHGLERALDHDLISRCLPDTEAGPTEVPMPDAEARPTETRQRGIKPVRLELPVWNVNRSVGSMLSGEIARRFGPEGLPEGTIQVTFRGTAGQSFGAWGAPGLTLVLVGEANDYTGKGLSGGTVVVTPPEGAGYEPERSVVTGNVALYGATGGEAYFRGVAGERFAVRNSGAQAVVEGVGDHGCEYMTGGTVVVLGQTGRNFAAGMSGGVAFVLDLWGRFGRLCNTDMVGLEPVEDAEDVALLRRLLTRHLEWTGSSAARRVLSNWSEYQRRFVKVMPHDLRRALAREEARAQGDEAAAARAV